VGREAYEEGVEIMGLHMVEGVDLWMSYIEFEKAIRDVKEADEGGEEEDINARLISLYMRSLSIPLINSEDILLDAESSIKGEMIGESENAYQVVAQLHNKSKKEMKVKDSYELRISVAKESGAPAGGTSEYETLGKVWMDYINHELKGSKSDHDLNIRRARCVAERAIVDCCLYLPIWNLYIDFLLEIDGMQETARSVIQRAVRNITWSSKLWIKYMTVLESIPGESVDDINSIVNTVLYGSGLASENDYLEFLVHVIGYHRRRALTGSKNANIVHSIQSLQQYYQSSLAHFPQLVFNLDCMAARLFSSSENFKLGKAVWESILKVRGSEAYVWLEYISFCRNHLKNMELTRTTYNRAIKSVTDFPSLISSSWYMFEGIYYIYEGVMKYEIMCIKTYIGEEGTLESLMKSSALISGHSEKIERHLQMAASVATIAVQQQEMAGNEEEKGGKEKRSRKREERLQKDASGNR
jgi:hypothetical protein